MKHWNLLFLVIIFFSCSKQLSDSDERPPIEKGEFVNDWEYRFFMQEPDQNAFKMWIPEGVSPRAILVLSTGGANDGRYLADDEKWQAYATKERLAIIGTYVRSTTSEASFNLLYALDEICKRNTIEEVSKLPILINGFSHGGVFSYQFSLQHPDRTLAFSNIKGSMSPSSSASPPGLLIVGDKDLASRNATIKNTFLSLRSQGSIVCYAADPNGYHSVDDKTNDLVRSFFTAILKKRLVNNKIVTIDKTSLYLGSLSTFKTYPYSAYPEDRATASSLIDEDFTTAWINFVK
ncbi:hypothetical protein [Polaribacter pacificus]|uniref:hypothetical protein n=1 Tax=Polaribacter pacificus TaxID=1775173 RepID=UPI00166EA022|nr:hypothetical protein [Polaribacter pacificus]